MRKRPAKTPQVWSFFTGAMGLDLGLELGGVRSTLAVEVDRSCCETIRHNRPSLDVWEADVTGITSAGLRARVKASYDVFLMVGGPPCQSFSSAGKRAALSDPRGNLIYTYLHLIREVRPRYFVLENVANIVTAATRHRPISERPGKRWNLNSYHGRANVASGSAAAMHPDELSGSAIRRVFEDVAKLGYSVRFSIADAADYGAPQHRLRFVMVGSREGPAPFLPAPTHGPRSASGRPWLTVRDAIADLHGDPGPHSVYTSNVSRYFAMVPSGGNWRSLPPATQREALGAASFAAGGGKTGFFRRLGWDAPSPTITGRANRKGSAMCHPSDTRPLSVRECARLQGFADDWTFSGSMSDQYLQVGNAVPVHLGRAVAEAILTHQGDVRGRRADEDFDGMFAKAVATLRASARNKRVRAPRKPSPQLELFQPATRLIGA